MTKLKIVDAFGGIGAFRMGAEQALGKENIEVVAYYDIDKYAVKSYNEIYGENHEPTDICKLQPEEVPDHDVWCSGFPCQSFSMSGNRGGFSDTRGTLFFEIMRIVKTKRTPYLLLENVEGLLNHDNTKTFETILRTLDECGYDAQWQVFNSKYFGVPQTRSRIFIIANLRTNGNHRPKVFPITEGYQKTDYWRGISEQDIAATITANEDKLSRGMTLINENRLLYDQSWCNGYNSQANRIDDSLGLAPTLNTRDEVMIKVKTATKLGYDIAKEGDGVKLDHPGSSTGRGRVQRGMSPTITTGDNTGVVTNNGIRRLTPLEKWRCQGFEDEAFRRAEIVCSERQLGKQAGNSLTVNVAEAIFRKWFKGDLK